MFWKRHLRFLDGHLDAWVERRTTVNGVVMPEPFWKVQIQGVDQKAVYAGMFEGPYDVRR